MNHFIGLRPGSKCSVAQFWFEALGLEASALTLNPKCKLRPKTTSESSSSPLKEREPNQMSSLPRTKTLTGPHKDRGVCTHTHTHTHAHTHTHTHAHAHAHTHTHTHTCGICCFLSDVFRANYSLPKNLKTVCVCVSVCECVCV